MSGKIAETKKGIKNMNSLLDPLTKQAFLQEREAALAKLEKAGWDNVRQMDVVHAIDSDELEWHLRQMIDRQDGKMVSFGPDGKRRLQP